MMSKCINPQCSSVFRYLHEGKLFHVRASDAARRSDSKPALQDEFFWLCEECSKDLTIAIDPVKGVSTVPRSGPRALRAAS